jgi:hypothetical protein
LGIVFLPVWWAFVGFALIYFVELPYMVDIDCVITQQEFRDFPRSMWKQTKLLPIGASSVGLVAVRVNRFD